MSFSVLPVHACSVTVACFCNYGVCLLVSLAPYIHSTVTFASEMVVLNAVRHSYSYVLLNKTCACLPLLQREITVGIDKEVYSKIRKMIEGGNYCCCQG